MDVFWGLLMYFMALVIGYNLRSVIDYFRNVPKRSKGNLLSLERRIAAL